MKPIKTPNPKIFAISAILLMAVVIFATSMQDKNTQKEMLSPEREMFADGIFVWTKMSRGMDKNVY